ncbi:MAG: SDR family NAD(P)-dependent oxidoreductase [Spongiibacteraceae bacterium]
MASVVITGSSKGIGFGLAREFACQGHQVTISGSSEQSVQVALVKLQAEGITVQGEAANVQHHNDLQALWDSAVAAYGRVDIWINNAGLARTVWSILDTPAEEISAMVSTNMLGTTYGSQVAARGMQAQGGGKIFNMLGGGSDGEIFPGMGIYGSTKRGLDYFTNALTKELKDSPVIIGKIRPGMIITEGVIREARADFENFQKSRKIMNNLVDTIDTVAPWLVQEILSTEKSGRKIRWLNGGKIARRMLMSRIKPRPDQFTAFGL